MAAPHVLILGLGYVGTALANRIASKHPDWTVTGTVRSPVSSTTLSKQRASYPLDSRVEKIEYGGVADHVATHGITHVLSTIPPMTGNTGCGPRAADGADHPLRALRALRSRRVWAGYVSTTSVYGDHGGAVVDEGSPLVANGRNEVFIAEERAWYECEAFQADVFRCGGIYGPYRNVLDSLVRTRGSGTASRRRGKAITMRCHVLDVCRVIEKRMAAWEEGQVGNVQHGQRVYNIVDDDPIARQAVEDHVMSRSSLLADYCALLARDGHDIGCVDGFFDRVDSIEVGDVIDSRRDVARGVAALYPWPSHSELRGEKRVSNRRIKEDLGIQLCFPSVQDGLKAIVYRGDMRPFVN